MDTGYVGTTRCPACHQDHEVHIFPTSTLADGRSRYAPLHNISHCSICRVEIEYAIIYLDAQHPIITPVLTVAGHKAAKRMHLNGTLPLNYPPVAV